MKKVLFLLIFPVFTIPIYSIELPGRNLYIEGTAETEDHQTFFMDNFKMEAETLGYTVVDTREEAAYTFRFDDQSYEDEFEPSYKFNVIISLLLNEGEKELVSFDCPYAELEEMYEYNQYLFFRAAILIPNNSADDSTVLAVTVDDTWRNKWFYFRASFDYPVVFNVLKSEGLYNGVAVYNDKVSPEWFNVLDRNKINALPGLTAGIEFQFLPFMSLEVNFQAGLGDTEETRITKLNLAAGAQLKFPLKIFSNFVIEPYAAFVYPVAVSDAFQDFPLFFIGGGVQVCVKGGKNGAFFIDVNYIFPPPVDGFNKVTMKNPFITEKTPDVLPKVIQYDRFSIGISAGYKFGVLNRK